VLEGKLSIVMPAYNESDYIERNLHETVDTLSEMGYEFEVIVVDDGSQDNTHLEAVKVCSHHPERVRVVRYDRNQGKGNALMCGTRYASGDYVVFLDADMDLHPRQLPVLFEILETQGADVVIGSKRHPLSNVNYPRLRKVLSNGYFLMTRLLFGLPLRDTQTGLKVFKRNVIANVFPRILAKRFAFDVEVLAAAHYLGFKISDAPVSLRFNRSFNRISLGDIYHTFLDTLAIFYRLRILRYYDTIHDFEFAPLSDKYESREVRDDDGIIARPVSLT